MHNIQFAIQISLWSHSLKEPEDQVARWLEGMAEFNYEVVHRLGKQHIVMELSRGQCRQCGLDVHCTEFVEEEEVVMAVEASILPVWSNQDIRILQKADANLGTVIEWLESGITSAVSTKFNPVTPVPVNPVWLFTG